MLAKQSRVPISNTTLWRTASKQLIDTRKSEQVQIGPDAYQIYNEQAPNSNQQGMVAARAKKEATQGDGVSRIKATYRYNEVRLKYNKGRLVKYQMHPSKHSTTNHIAISKKHEVLWEMSPR